MESLYKLLVENNAQMSITRCIPFLEGTFPVNTKQTRITKVFNTNDALICLFYQKYFDNAAWAKMYHCSLLEVAFVILKDGFMKICLLLTNW
ncbi:hypothetical protein SFC43_06230 [Bacteroides sp. CR5/BHMF/2]|nr:hypothetical protein [Bacteroides sp. CR5/BHMF/2]